MTIVAARKISRRAILMVALSTFVVTTSCAKYDADPTVIAAVPTREQFSAVSSVLEPNCGTLDCHGNPARNFRVYGKRGLRARGDDSTGASDTNEADIDATYQSIVGIAPEALRDIYEQHGKDAQNWIVLSKARGRERHTGGVRLPQSSPGDRCLVSWMSGAVDNAACNADVFGPLPRAGESW